VLRTEVDVVEQDGGGIVFFDAADGSTWGNFRAATTAREFRLAVEVAVRELFPGRCQLPFHYGCGEVPSSEGFDSDLSGVCDRGCFAGQEEAVVDLDTVLIHGDLMGDPDDGENAEPRGGGMDNPSPASTNRGMSILLVRIRV
jgi:hypothetical protein